MVDATTQTESTQLQQQQQLHDDIAQQSKASASPAQALELQADVDKDAHAATWTESDTKQEDHENDFTPPRSVVKELLDLISSGEESSSSSSDLGDSSADEGERPGSAPPYPRLASDVGLPWPSILSYLRESEESLTIRQIKISDDDVATSGTCSRSGSVGSAQDEKYDPRQHDPTLCHFCEQPAPSFSLLPANLTKEPEFCCEDYRDYCVLVAAYTKKMMDDAANQRPGKIRFKYEEPALKMNAQDKALEKVRKKRKWELHRRIQLDKLKDSSYYRLSHQTKTIQFSLSAATSLPTNWVANTLQQNETKVLANIPRRRSEPPALPTSSQLLSGKSSTKTHRLSEAARGIHRTTTARKSHMLYKVKQVEYPDREGMALLTLPDGTIQCYYPSQRLAVMVFPLYEGVLASLLFQDMDKGGPVGYCDELGRAWLTRDHASLWFASTPHDCFVFDSVERCRHWEWRNVASYSILLPLLLRVNKYISLRYNSQDNILLTFISEQVRHKVRFHRKVKDIGSLSEKSPATSKSKSQLHELTCKFNGHLHCMQQSLRAMKAEQQRQLPPLGRFQLQVKKTRSRSTGIVSFKS